MSTSETGHAKSVANFETLINYCNGYGAAYKPSSPGIMMESLNSLLASAKTCLEIVATAKAGYDHTTNAREIAFKPLSKLCTRVINALDACGASKEKMDDARSIINKLQGRGTGKKEKSTTPDPNQPASQSTRHVTTSHRSFDSQINNLGNLIQLLLTESNYKPNEPELSISSLSTLLIALQSANLEAKITTTNLSNARIERDNILYLSNNSLCETAADVKKYVKSAFGADNPKYRQISKIAFPSIPTTV